MPIDPDSYLPDIYLLVLQALPVPVIKIWPREKHGEDLSLLHIWDGVQYWIHCNCVVI